jgi:hypothetical protein
MTNEDADERLDSLLQASEQLDRDVEKLIDRVEPRGRRAIIGLALCRAAHEHAMSQRLLFEAGHNLTALALLRLQFEAVVRAAWTNQGATESWLDAFTTPVEGEGHREPITGPPIPSMLNAFEPFSPHVASEFRKLYGTIGAMHSFVHGGAQAVVHALRPYPAEKLISALLNRNLLQWYTANCALVASESVLLRPRLSVLKEKHAQCMPPAAA